MTTQLLITYSWPLITPPTLFYSPQSTSHTLFETSSPIPYPPPLSQYTSLIVSWSSLHSPSSITVNLFNILIYSGVIFIWVILSIWWWFMRVFVVSVRIIWWRWVIVRWVGFGFGVWGFRAISSGIRVLTKVFSLRRLGCCDFSITPHFT